MRLKGSILVTVKEIQIIIGSSSYEVARREHQKVRQALKKTSKYLTLKEYCEYFEIPYNDAIEFINRYR